METKKRKLKTTKVTPEYKLLQEIKKQSDILQEIHRLLDNIWHERNV